MMRIINWLSVWESVNIFLPAAIKKISLTFYLQAICPVVPPPDPKMPLIMRLLISTTPPVDKPTALLGLIILTGILLAACAARARKLEINYATE